ncbi:MAG: M20/M25/M40 family metallo-hydrolase [Caldilineaceae bacterium]|nr:M20/M25/M40 family metallo-hydrolase [Caldilineaceae bacterium]
MEPDLAVTATPVDLPPAVMDPAAQRTLLDALTAMPQGVMRMSDAVPGLVETSINTGIVAVEEGDIDMTMLMRSSVDSELDGLDQMVAAVWDLAGMPVAFSGRYAGWNPNPNAPLVVLMQDVYTDLFGQSPTLAALHAGLECGTISALYPGMDAISIGPTLYDVHTPAERLEVASVEKVYNLVLETLVRIAAQDAAGAQT